MYMEWNFIKAPNGDLLLSSNSFSIRNDVIKLFGELNIEKIENRNKNYPISLQTNQLVCKLTKTQLICLRLTG